MGGGSTRELSPQAALEWRKGHAEYLGLNALPIVFNFNAGLPLMAQRG